MAPLVVRLHNRSKTLSCLLQVQHNVQQLNALGIQGLKHFLQRDLSMRSPAEGENPALQVTMFALENRSKAAPACVREEPCGRATQKS